MIKPLVGETIKGALLNEPLLFNLEYKNGMRVVVLASLFHTRSLECWRMRVCSIMSVRAPVYSEGASSHAAMCVCVCVCMCNLSG